jgi:hypothetical protein
MTELKEIKEKRFLKQIGGVLFGVVISLGITSSIQTGAGFIFGTESEQWGIGFWGNHHILRVIASLLGTSIGSFSAGCIAKIRGKFWGMMSAIPTSLFWLVVGVFALSQFFNENNSLEITIVNWAVIVILVVANLVIGYYAGAFGEGVRLKNSDIFEYRTNLILGIKWYHWFWLFTLIHWIVMLGTFSVFQGIFLFFGTNRQIAFYGVNPVLAIFLVGLALSLLGLSAIKIFGLLLFSYKESFTKRQILLRVLGWISVIIMIVGGFQSLTGYLMAP